MNITQKEYLEYCYSYTPYIEKDMGILYFKSNIYIVKDKVINLNLLKDSFQMLEFYIHNFDTKIYFDKCCFIKRENILTKEIKIYNPQEIGYYKQTNPYYLESGIDCRFFGQKEHGRYAMFNIPYCNIEFLEDVKNISKQFYISNHLCELKNISNLVSQLYSFKLSKYEVGYNIDICLKDNLKIFKNTILSVGDEKSVFIQNKKGSTIHIHPMDMNRKISPPSKKDIKFTKISENCHFVLDITGSILWIYKISSNLNNFIYSFIDKYGGLLMNSKISLKEYIYTANTISNFYMDAIRFKVIPIENNFVEYSMEEADYINNVKRFEEDELDYLTSMDTCYDEEIRFFSHISKVGLSKRIDEKMLKDHLKYEKKYENYLISLQDFNDNKRVEVSTLINYKIYTDVDSIVYDLKVILEERMEKNKELKGSFIIRELSQKKIIIEPTCKYETFALIFYIKASYELEYMKELIKNIPFDRCKWIKSVMKYTYLYRKIYDSFNIKYNDTKFYVKQLNGEYEMEYVECPHADDLIIVLDIDE